ncbi:asc-type amino acid transporter 1 isoform X1 [Passer montanus]|uniref:asc-type amino acid transporter 1 isoform X1 n=1 Tax=Passer montanus TaxID=9160 RepID=UPI00195FD40D|nr:asc-type amino acid transporter 1 isoform X1 [Passer montanus]
MAGGEQRAPGGPARVALKKEIGLVSACAIIIGNIIGSGIFISPKGVLEHAGSVGLALIIWVLGGGVAALGSLCYAELGVTIPKSGGDYSYVTEIFGGLAGFLLLWSAVLIMYPTSLAVIALTFSNYVLQPVFPNCIPPYNASRILSMVCLLLLTWVNSSSVRWATRIQDIFTAGKLLALTLIIIVGFIQIFKGNYKELTPSNAFRFWMTPSVGHLALAFLQGSFAFSGWNFLNYVTEELVDPRRNLPRAIFISIPLVTFVYTFTNIAYFTAMSPQELLSSNAVAVTFGEKLLGYFSWVMPVSVALSTFGGINGYLFTSSRLCFSGAREGHLPSLLAMIHVKNCTPIPALLICCLATLIIMLVGDTYTLINYVSFINYLCYGVTIIGLIVLRWKKPKIFRPIKVTLLQLHFWVVIVVQRVGWGHLPDHVPGRSLVNLLGYAEGRTVVEGRGHSLGGLEPALPAAPHPTATALHSPALLCSLLVGEPPHPHHLPGVLGLSAGLQPVLRAHRLWGWTHYHFNWSASVFPWSLLEK